MPTFLSSEVSIDVMCLLVEFYRCYVCSIDVALAQLVYRQDLEKPIEFRSLISRLVARVDMPILNGIASNGLACTNVINLFGMCVVF